MVEKIIKRAQKEKSRKPEIKKDALKEISYLEKQETDAICKETRPLCRLRCCRGGVVKILSAPV